MWEKAHNYNIKNSSWIVICNTHLDGDGTHPDIDNDPQQRLIPPSSSNNNSNNTITVTPVIITNKSRMPSLYNEDDIDFAKMIETGNTHVLKSEGMQK